MFAEGRQHGLPGSRYLLEQIGDENIRPLQRIECITEKKDVEQRIAALPSCLDVEKMEDRGAHCR